MNVLVKVGLTFSYYIYTPFGQKEYDVNTYRITLFSDRNLGKYKGLYRIMFIVKSVLQISIGYQTVIWRFAIDLFNINLAAFHIKQ